MKYAKLFNLRATPQSQPIPGSGQVPNHAGGHAWTIDPWAKLDRFLILGSESGTYYVQPRELTHRHAKNLVALIEMDGRRVVERIVEISTQGRAPKNDPAIFALAMVAASGEEKVRAEALRALPKVCRTGTHLFQFAAVCDGLRGWGRGLRRAIGDWYNAKSVEQLELQLVKYQQRERWSNRDLLRLAHPKPATEGHRALFRWVTQGEAPVGMAKIEAMERLKSLSGKEAAALIAEARLPREAVPTELLKDPAVWDALLADMPMTAMIRNLATMTRVGLLAPGSEAVRRVVRELSSEERLRKARIHPMALLMAQRTYASGCGHRGSGTWEPVPAVVDALDNAFYAAFGNVRPTGKRYLLGVDVSGSMEQRVAGSSITACEVATAMAMLTVATEDAVTPMAFAHRLKSLPLSRRMRLDDALRHTRSVNFGGTDCALPMLHALKHRLEIDVFVVYTDSETWYGKVHPVQALTMYRQRMGLPAKLIVVGITANEFTIADPRDPGMLDVVGFDTSVPEVMADFARQ